LVFCYFLVLCLLSLNSFDFCFPFHLLFIFACSNLPFGIVDYFLMVYNLDVKSAARLDLIYI